MRGEHCRLTTGVPEHDVAVAELVVAVIREQARKSLRRVDAVEWPTTASESNGVW